jgi:hypothetical protein
MIDTADLRAIYQPGNPGIQLDISPAVRRDIGALCDEVDRLRAAINRAIDYATDDDNRDEMSSDAQEWISDMIQLLGGRCD